MIQIIEHLTVNRPIGEVFSFLSDFARLPEWDPGISSSVKKTPGSLHIGTEFDIVSDFFGNKIPMVYRLKDFRPNQQVVYEGFAENLHAIDSIFFNSTEEGTRILYKAEFTLKGKFTCFEWAFRPLLYSTGKNAIEGIKLALQIDPVEIPSMSFFNRIGDRLILPGLLKFGSIGLKSRKKKWKPVTKLMQEYTIVITGGGSGIGLATAIEFARQSAVIVLVGYQLDRLQKARENIIQETGNEKIRIEVADLSLQKEVRSLSERLLNDFEKIDILVNNAGALFNERSVTAEGIEKSLSLLLLSPVLLTSLLLPKILLSKDSRVIFVSSGGMYTQKLPIEDLQNEKNYNGSVAYARAKRGLVVATEMFASDSRNASIRFHCMHPGWVKTEAVQTSLPEFYSATKKILRTPKEGADTIVWLATSEEARLVNGEFWLDREIHPKEVFSFTKSSAEERANFWRQVRDLIGLVE